MDFPPLPNTNRTAISLLDGDDDRSNASTQALTRGSGSLTTAQARFRELEAMMQRQQKLIDSQAKKSADRLTTIERHLHRLDALDQKISQVGDQVQIAASSHQESLSTLRRDIENQTATIHTQNTQYQNHCDTQITSLSENVLNAMNGIVQMRDEFEKLSTMMMQTITRPSPGPKRRKQRIHMERIDNTYAGIPYHDNMQLDSDESATGEDVETDGFSDNSFSHDRINLNAMFQQTEVRHAASKALPNSPPTTPTKNESTTPTQTQEQSTPAPLNSQNTQDMGSAGARII